MLCALQKDQTRSMVRENICKREYKASMTLLGKVLENKYEVVGNLGEGGMGAVYLGVHVKIGRKVAIKVLHHRFSDNVQAVQRFYREARIAGNLGHANICDVMDIGKTEEGVPFMVMPLLEGSSLAEELDACGALSPPRALDIMSQVLSALSVAHEAGIVHRDLKPENIFLTRMGDRADFVKVLDFGISKVISEAAPTSDNLTTTGMVMGTPFYMSPEQAKGAKDVDPRTDIYAAGVLLYFLLTGVHPFEADSYNELIVKIVTEPFNSPRSHNPAIPVSVEAVILKAMQKDPDERFSTAAEFKEALLTQARDSGLGLPSRAGGSINDADGSINNNEQVALKAEDDEGGGFKGRAEGNSLSGEAKESHQPSFSYKNTDSSPPGEDDLVIRGGKRWILPSLVVGGVLIFVAVLAVGFFQGFLGRSSQNEKETGGKETLDGIGNSLSEKKGLKDEGDLPGSKQAKPATVGSASAGLVNGSDGNSGDSGDSDHASVVPTDVAPADVGSDAGDLRTVTIEFEDVPEEGEITLEGRKISKSGVSVPFSKKPLEYKVRVKGYETLIGEVVPNRDRQITINKYLRPAKPKRKPMVKRGRRPSKNGRKKEPERKPRVIRGPRETLLDTNYDG